MQKNIKLEKNNSLDWHNYKKLIADHKLIYKNQVNKVAKLFKKNQIKKYFLSHSQKYIDSLNKVNAKSNTFLTFNAKICYCIREKSKKKIYFYILVNARKGKILELSLYKKEPNNIYQIHYIEKNVFSLILRGKVMLNECQWSTEIKQVKKFDNLNRDLLFHIGYHVDGDNRTPEIKIRKIYSVK